MGGCVDILEATANYEGWIGRYVDPLVGDFRQKHDQMREDSSTFLRATFYRWAQKWGLVAAQVRSAPKVLAIGDAHVENFGTWRDTEGRLAWGVNDFDEAVELPYTNDLVRLAVSAVLAHSIGKLAIAPNRIAAAMLRGYEGGLRAGGRAVVLDSGPRWLRELLPKDFDDPVRYWGELLAEPVWREKIPQRARRLLGDVVSSARLVRTVHRLSGVGSLGRPRITAIYIADGGYLAREVKARAPSAWWWAHPDSDGSNDDPLPRIWRNAIRSQDPYLQASKRWILRRLGPDCTRIKLTKVPSQRRESALLMAMGWELANTHMGSPEPRRIREHVGTLRRHWLEEAVEPMVDSVNDDFSRWRGDTH